MAERPIRKILITALWIIGTILAVLILISFIPSVDYPDWMNKLISNGLLIGLSLALFYKAYQVRLVDRKFATIYLVAGVALVVIVLLSFTFIRVIAIVGLGILLVTHPGVRRFFGSHKDQQTNQ